jgi:HEAT repeats
MRGRLRWALALAGLAAAAAVGVVVLSPRERRDAVPKAYDGGEPASWWATRCQIGRLDEQSLPGRDDWWNWWTYRPAGRILDEHEIPDENYAECTRLIQGDPQAVPVLLELLRHSNSSVRQAAIYGLAQAARHNCPEALAAVEAALWDDRDPTIICFAAWALRTWFPDRAAALGVPKDDLTLMNERLAWLNAQKAESAARRQNLPLTVVMGLGVLAVATTVVWRLKLHRRTRQYTQG